jgi:membrane fusion protein
MTAAKGMKNETQENLPQSGAPDVVGEAGEYPPDTARYLSWATVRFIRSPTILMFDLAVLVLLAMLVLCIFLSYYIEIDISVKGSTEIISELGVREAIALSDGVITNLSKRTGEDVLENEVIAVVSNDTAPLEEVEKATVGLEQLVSKVNTARQSSELSANEILEFPSARINDPTLLQELATAQQALRTFEEQRRRILVQFDSSNELHFTRERIKLLTSKLLKMKSSKQRDLLQLYIESTDEELGRLKSQVLLGENQLKVKLGEALSELLRSLQVAQGALENYKRQHEVRSPISGTIAKMIYEENSFVTAKKPIASIVPKTSRFIAEIEVPSKDIAKVKSGQDVFYRVEAYPYQRYGLFTGQVIAVDQVAMGGGPAGVDNFKVRASIEKPSALPDEVKAQIRYVVGMKSDAKIITERKSVKDLFVETFFFKPWW